MALRFSLPLKDLRSNGAEKAKRRLIKNESPLRSWLPLIDDGDIYAKTDDSISTMGTDLVANTARHSVATLGDPKEKEKERKREREREIIATCHGIIHVRQLHASRFTRLVNIVIRD
jgi:hypothetical protein